MKNEEPEVQIAAEIVDTLDMVLVETAWVQYKKYKRLCIYKAFEFKAKYILTSYF